MANRSMFAACFVCLHMPALAVVIGEKSALTSDDECEEGSCALSALQRRGEKLVDDMSSGLQDMLQSLSDKVDLVTKENAALRTRISDLEQSRQLPGGVAPKTWNGGGKVDGLNGEAQVQIMTWRDKNWKIGGVVYQIFVDRFTPPKDLEAKKLLHPAPETVHEWHEEAKGGRLDKPSGYYTNELEFWGGDLKGVTSKLDYVSEFADIVYLQPIFEAYSVHKYDTSDYLKLDRTYGTLEDFNNLTNEIHKRGMFLMLDGVFNHMGIRSPKFKTGLQNSSSDERGWYFIGEKYGKRGYKTWQNGNTLVELHLEDPTLQDYIWKGNDSVIATWLKRGADGFRLDVGTELGREVLWKLTTAAHKHKFNSNIVGEVSAYPRWWTEAMDGVMSFWMGWQINGLVSEQLSPEAMGWNIEKLIHDTSMEQVLQSWIITSNHDLPRLAYQYPDPQIRKLVLTLMFVLPGSPCLYYGEEIGMLGAGDPQNRNPMRWQDVTDDNIILNHTRSLVQYRRYIRALRIGDFHALRSDKIFAFVRRTDRVADAVIVLVNARHEAIEEMVGIPDENLLEFTQFRDIFTGETVRIHGATCTIRVPGRSARILTMVDEQGNPNGDQYKRIYGHWATFPNIKAASSAGKWSVDEKMRDVSQRPLPAPEPVSPVVKHLETPFSSK